MVNLRDTDAQAPLSEILVNGPGWGPRPRILGNIESHSGCRGGVANVQPDWEPLLTLRSQVSIGV